MKDIVLLVFLSGCRKVYPCDGSTVLVNFAPNLDAVGHDDLRQALHVWDVYGCGFRTKDELTQDQLSRVHGETLQVTGHSFGASPSTIGVYEYGGTAEQGYIVLDTDLFNGHSDYDVHVVAHEVGHAFGMNHVPQELGNAIMNPVSNDIIVPTALDYDMWCRLWCDKQVDPGGEPDPGTLRPATH